MAGEILSVAINADGWSANITVAGLTATGITYDYGLTGNNVPTAPKIVFLVTSKGFDENGNAVNRQRRVIATKTVRKVYPNNAQLDETNSGSDCIIRVALSDMIFAKDKIGAGNSGVDVAVTFLSGWVVKSAVTSQSVAVVATNNSTSAYPKVGCKRAWFNFEKIQASTYLLEVVPIGHYTKKRRTFACVKYTCTDESANSVSATLTNWDKSTRIGPVTTVVCAGTISLATLTKQQLCTCHLQVYPWIGDTTEVIDTLRDSESDLDHVQTGPVYFFNDKDSDYSSSCAFVDITSGNDGTGVAAALTDTATASATPFKTIINAREAIVARNLAQYSRQDLNGAVIYLKAGTHKWVGDSTTNSQSSNKVKRNTDKCELLITRDAAASEATVIVNTLAAFGVAQNQIKTQRYRISGITIGETVASSSKDIQGLGLGDPTDCVVIYDCGVNQTQSSCDLTYLHAASQIINSRATTSNKWPFKGGTGSSSTEKCTLARNNTWHQNGVSAICYTMIGNLCNSFYSNYGACASNILIFMNRLELGTSGGLLEIVNTVDVKNIAIVGNCMVHWNNAAGTLCFNISAESATGKWQDGTFAYNSLFGTVGGTPFNGARINYLYNNSSTQIQQKDGNRTQFNFYRQFNAKTDVFATSALAINNWYEVYCVGHVGNCWNTSAVDERQFVGLYSANVATAGVNVVSATDTSASGGDYTPTSSSNLLSFSKASYGWLPWDLSGNRRDDEDGSSGAYAATAEGALTWVDIAGANSPNYSVVGSGGNNGKLVRCVANNPQGAATSNTATLTVV